MNEAISKLMAIVLEHADQLGQQVYEVHQELERWKEPPLDKMDRTKLHIKLEKAIQQQHKCLAAAMEVLEGS